jgi:hypothetical protein
MLTGAELPCHSWAGRNICGQTVVAGAIVWRAAPYTPATRSVC